MKKTLLGVLAFVLVLATVLTGTVLAADGDAATTSNVGKVFRLSDSADPIVVDGEMDEAYKSAVPLLINSRPDDMEGIYTYGFARFVWSKAENAVYCYVIINDAEINVPGDKAYRSDSVELFLGLSGKNTQEWGIDGLSGNGVLERGLQYRIDGYTGMATCFLTEETRGSSTKDSVKNTYYLNEELGRLENKDGNKLINETLNLFGWEYHPDDQTKNGWGQKLHADGKGYSVEFRINANGLGLTLAGGMDVLFDFQVNDRFAVDANGDGTRSVLYYTSVYREAQGAGAGLNMQYYDCFTLSDDTVENGAANKVSEQELTKYGKGDPLVEYEEPKEEATKTTTTKKTFNRPVASRATDGGNANNNQNNDNNNNNNNNNNNDNNNNATTTTTPTTTGGGCGSSVAVGTSVAMIALIGATGFFAFRRKEEE